MIARSKYSLIRTGVFLLMSLLFSFSCKEKPKDDVTLDLTNGVFIVNEGNFQSGNASIDFYHRATGTVDRKVFQSATGRPLGDVAQSLTFFNGKAWIVVNNSGKIEVLNLPAFDPFCTVYNLTSPRYFLPLSSTKAYVSDLYSGSIQVVNPSNCSVTGSIYTNGWTEQMVVIGNQVFACMSARDKVLVIDKTLDYVIDSIQVSQEPNSMVADINGKLWVLCSGGLSQAYPMLHRIDPVTRIVEASLSFPFISQNPTELNINAGKDTLYFINDGISKMSVYSGAIPSFSFIPSNGRNYYSLGIDPQSGEIFAGDAIDYVQNGWVYRFNANTGTELGSVTSGIIPGAFGFQ